MEKNNKKLEDFFQKRLLENENVTDGLDGPPEFVWNNAQPSFPNRQKKNRKFLFWLFPGIILIAGLGILMMGSHKNDPSNSIDASLNTMESQLDSEIASMPVQIIDSIDKKSEIKSEAQKSKSDVATNEVSPKLLNQNNTIQVFQTKTNQVTTTKDKLAPSKRFNKSSKLFSMPSSSLIEGDNEISVDRIEKKYKENFENDKIIKVSNATEKIPVLNTLLIYKYTPKFKPRFVSTVINNRQWNHEVGVSSSRFIENAFELDDEDAEENSRLTVNSKMYNLNLEYKKPLGKKWYLASGLNLSRINARFQFSQEIPFFGGNQASLLRTDLYSFSNLTVQVDKNEENIPFEYLQDLNIPIGTPVSFNLDFGLKISAVEMPIELNYHLDRGNWEFLIGGGVSLNYYKYHMETEPLKVLYEGDIITQSLSVNDIKVNEFNWNITTYAGIKYKFTKKINAGLHCRVEPYDISLARIGLGLYYRL